MRTVTATCTTEGCRNAGHPITLDVDDDVTAVACGPCGAVITDVKSAS